MSADSLRSRRWARMRKDFNANGKEWDANGRESFSETESNPPRTRNEEGQIIDQTLPDPVPDQALLEFFLPSRKAVMDSSGRKKPLICSFAGTAPNSVR